MTRIEGLPESKAGLLARLAYRYGKKRLGKVPQPMTITAHHPWIFRGYAAYEFALERSQLVPHRVKALVSLTAATLVGCPF